MDQLSKLVSNVTDALEAGPQGAVTLPAPRDLQRRLVLLDKLGMRLDAASTILAGWWSHREWRDQFGAAGWPARRERLAEALRKDEEAGSRQWLAHWVRAMAAGAFDEAERLCTSGLALSPPAAWWPERCLSSAEAFRFARWDPWQAQARFVDVPLWLQHEEDLPPGDRVALLLMAARVCAHAGEGTARELLETATQIARSAPSGEELPARNSILAASSYVERQLADTDQARGWLDRLRPAALADLACAVELLQWNQLRTADSSVPDDGLHYEPVADTGALVASLPDIAGVAEALEVLVDDVPAELLLELAIRLHREGEYQRAFDLITILPASAGGTIGVRAAELLVQLAEQGVPDGVDLVDVLVAAADQASRAGQDDDALGWLERALALRPEDATLARRVAEAMTWSAGPSGPGQTRSCLYRALELCDRADRLDPVPTAWAVSVRGLVHGALWGLLVEDRVEHMWRSLEFAARATPLAPREPIRWMVVALRLLSAGAPHLADVMARRAQQAVSATAVELDPSTEQFLFFVRAASAAATWQPAEVLDLLETAPSSDDSEILAWHHTLRGMALRMHGDLSAAEGEFLAAVQLSSDISIRLAQAETMTLLDEDRGHRIWRALWRDADVETPDGLNAAAWAALYLGMLTSATQLAGQSHHFTPARTGETEGPPTGQLILALVSVLEGRDDGWTDVSEVLQSIALAPVVREAGRYYEAMLLRAARAATARGMQTVSVDVDRLRDLVDRRARDAEALWPADDLAAARAEAEWLLGRPAPEPVARAMETALAVVVSLLDLPEETAPRPDGGIADTAESTPVEPAEDLTVRIVVPPHWFQGFEGRELEHDIFRRALPDARAAARLRVGEEPVVWVRVHVDEDLPDDAVALEFPGREPFHLGIRPGAWYARRSVLPPVSGDGRTAGHALADGLSLSEVPAPKDPEGRLTMWSAEDLVARIAIDGMVAPTGSYGSPARG